MNGARLHQLDRGWVVVELQRQGFCLLDEANGSGRVARRVLGHRGERQRLGKSGEQTAPSSRRYSASQPSPATLRIGLQQGQPSAEVGGSHLRSWGCLTSRKELVEPADALRGPTSDPEVAERGRDIQPTSEVTAGDAALKYRPDVVDLQVGPRQPFEKAVPSLI